MPPIVTSIPVTVYRISLRPEDFDSLICPVCGESMALHQPDSGFPERMLWTCEQCGTWFMMDLIPGKAEAVLVCLPDGAHFRSALGD